MLDNSILGEGVSTTNNNKKKPVPRLNLEVLPNYHAKSNKSLNQ